jgi:hypothetical protein
MIKKQIPLIMVFFFISFLYMSPSLLQLQAVGLQDIFLTKDPQINIFKYNYYRYVNFATETVKLGFNERVGFGKKVTCEVPKRGDLLSKVHLHIRLPPIIKNGGTYACWSDTLGYAIFDDFIELQIGGEIVDKLYPQFLNAWDELTSDSKKIGKNLMLLKSDTFTASKYNAEKYVDLIIPLDFWFTKQYNLSLPLLCMNYQDVKISFKLKNFSQCINYDGNEPNEVSILSANIITEYIFLDDIIREKFLEEKHRYIIDQVQYNGDELILNNTSVYNSKLRFNYPCKEFIFFAVENRNIENNNHFVYSKTGQFAHEPLISEASLLLDGKVRFDSLPEFYYRSVFPDSVHSVIPMKYVYVMPFSIKPENNQPTGSLNASKFSDITLFLKLPSDNVELKLFVFAISYNVLIINKGILSMEFM